MNRTWVGAGAILLVCMLCYANSLSGSFHYDDFHSIADNPHIRTLSNLPAFFIDPGMFSSDPEKRMYRPLLLVSYALNYALDGYQVRGYHLVNILLHLGCSLLVWRLGLRLCGSGLLAGLFFAAHPLASEPVNYISSRSESLAALCYLGALLAYLKAEDQPRFNWLSLGCFALGLFSKEVVLTLPAALCLVDRWRGQSTQWKRYAPYAALAGVYVLVLVLNRFLTDSLAAPVRSPWVQGWTQVKALAYYLKLAWMPQALNVEHQFFESAGPQAVSWWALALVLSLGYLAWRGGRTLPGLVLAWSLLVLLPVLAMPLNMLVNERRLYLVLAGLAWLIGYGGRARAFLYLLVPLCGALTWARNGAWKDELSLWQDALGKAPRMYRVQTNLGKALQLAGDHEGALQAYQKALKLDDRHGDAYNNIATILHQQGRLDEAIAWYHKAIERYPNHEEIYQNLADAHSEKGELEQAVAMYQQALKLNPKDGPAWNNCGQTLYQARRWAEAEEAFLRAIALIPQQPEPYNNLGNLYSGQGKYAQAVERYQQALERHPAQEAQVRLNLADAWKQAGRPELAIQALAQVVELDPGQNRARVQWAELLHEAGRHAEAVDQFQAAVDRDPQYARAWFGLARALEADQRRDQAAGAYRRFLELWKVQDGRTALARERLQLLEGRR
ncbi:MAG: tetratricopeptide repeat protein [Candidatus Latescibacteria bacterium]|nr:tetratricopeptide repeat protein [Candidatus Latescibacterota bacterium]